MLFALITGFEFSAISQVPYVTTPFVLDKNATYQETVNWLDRYWFARVGIGIDDKFYPKDAKTSRAFGFFKGFRLVGSENCLLTLRNEGSYKDSAKTNYVADAKIPLSDLDPAEAKVGSRAPYSPSVDGGYGLWGARFISTKSDLTVILDIREPEQKTYAGSVLQFTFQSEDEAIEFSKVFLRLIKKCHV